MYKLFIADEEAELSRKSRIQLSRLILDLEDISKRGIVFSNTIRLPFSAKNDKVCGYPSRLSSNNQAFEVNQTYLLFYKDTILSTGSVVLKECDVKEGITIQLAEGYSFWSQIGKSLMIDLNLFSYDFVFNNANLIALEPKTSSIWLNAYADWTNEPIIHAGEDCFIRPFYRYRLLINEIVEQAGYTLDETNLTDLTNYDNIGLSSNGPKFFVTDLKRRFQDETIAAGNIDISVGSSEFFYASGSTTLATDTLTNNDYKTSYALKGWVVSNFETSIVFQYTLGAITKSETLIIPIGRTYLSFRTDEIGIGSDTILILANEVTFEDVRIYSCVNESDIFAVEGAFEGPSHTAIFDGWQVLSDQNLPDQTQATFFKNLLKMLFLKCDINEQKKEIKLSYFPDILSTNNAFDLTGKIVKDPPLTSGSTYGRLNIMQYVNDVEIDPALGAAYFSVQSENAQPKKDFLTIPEFSASREFTNGENSIFELVYDTVNLKRNVIKDRIVEFNPGVSIDYTANLAGVSMQRLYSANYVDFIESTKRERVLSAKVLLNYNDFRTLSNKPIIYDGNLQSYFLVTEISGWEVGEFTNIKLIKFL